MRTIKHETKEEAMTTFGRDFATAVKSGKWMAAVWRAKGDEIATVELVGRTTWNFPPEGFDDCVEDLRKNLMAEAGGSPVKSEPLPFADFLKKQVDAAAAAAREITGDGDGSSEDDVPDVPNPEGIPTE